METITIQSSRVSTFGEMELLVVAGAVLVGAAWMLVTRLRARADRAAEHH